MNQEISELVDKYLKIMNIMAYAFISSWVTIIGVFVSVAADSKIEGVSQDIQNIMLGLAVFILLFSEGILVRFFKVGSEAVQYKSEEVKKVIVNRFIAFVVTFAFHEMVIIIGALLTLFNGAVPNSSIFLWALTFFLVFTKLPSRSRLIKGIPSIQ